LRPFGMAKQSGKPGTQENAMPGDWPTFTFFVKVGTARSAVTAFLYGGESSVARIKDENPRRGLHESPPLPKTQRWATRRLIKNESR
ncbi:MAG TPA: hypothetical protein VIX11_14120, partial [Candidatus Acidoferrum sp.]